MSDKIRLDLFLKNNFYLSRQYSKEIIEKGLVLVNNKTVLKPSYSVCNEDNIRLLEAAVHKYVGRGGYKLEKALESFKIVLDCLVCMDIGSSTGGFTDCMLKNGAKKVFAVDVGTNQLNESLRKNPLVILMEQTDIRDVSADDIGGKVDFIGIDVSFISLTKISESIFRLLKDDGCAAALLKPQFEAGREYIGKGGIVKKPNIHKKVLKSVISSLKDTLLYVCGITYSPITGGDGNIEYLLFIAKDKEAEISPIILDDKVEEVVNSAFEALKGGKK